MSTEANAIEVSVVMPTHNRWELLQRSLASVMGQRDVVLEVIVVDDRSTDETPQGLAGIDDERLAVVRNEQPGSVASVRNLGVARARGRWVAFLDDDDLWAPDKLRRQLDAAEARAASFVYAGAHSVDLDLQITRGDLEPPDPDRVALQVWRRNLIPGGCSNAMVRADLLRELGGFDERLHVLADWDLWIRAANAGASAVVAERLVGYTEHPGNMVMRDQDRARAEFEVIVDKHRAAARAAGADVNGLSYYWWLADGMWRSGNRWQALKLMARPVRSFGNPSNLRDLASQLVVPGVRRLLGRKPARSQWLSEIG